MSLPGEVRVKCQCGGEFNATIWRTVNTHNAKLAEAFLKGTLNIAVCPQCGESFFVPYPVLYHDMQAALMVQVYDSSVMQKPSSGWDEALDKMKAAGANVDKLLSIAPIEVATVDGFGPARIALLHLHDRSSFLAMRLRHPSWPNCKLYKAVFLRAYEQAKHPHEGWWDRWFSKN